MHNRDEYPEIWNAKEKAENELSTLMTKRKIHTDEMKPLRAEIIELQGRVNALNDLAMVDIERINKLSADIARMAKAMGAVVLGK